MQVSDIRQLLGDRVLVKKLGRPGKIGGVIIPESHRKERRRDTLWFGEVELFGLDSRAPEGMDLEVGDLVACDVVGADCLTITTDDKSEHVWVPDEFIAVKDTGSIKAMYAEAA